FVGHGIGLELIEPPFIAKNRNDPLAPGMTFALEPKMVFEGVNFQRKLDGSLIRIALSAIRIKTPCPLRSLREIKISCRIFI
ncbi:MAG: M24 family metallopeptidase, partial [Desulfobacterales bacterium]|nr:M24 family metallopeptidase [Desulfobacterales bacterium]